MNLTKAIWYINTIISSWQYGHIGKHSYIGKSLFIQRKKDLYLGDNVRIYPGMRAEFVTDTAKIEIGNNVSIGQNFHVVSYTDTLKIEDNVTISSNVFISNVDHDYREINVHSLEQKMVHKKTVIGEYCFIGYGAVILPGARLGKQCIVGANSVVKGEYPDYCVIAGNPAVVLKRYDPIRGVWERISV